MRLIGHLADESVARVFGDYLYVLGIENQIEAQSQDGWAIWIMDEDKLQRAETLLADYRQNPQDRKYTAEAKGAAERRAAAEKEQSAYEKRVRDRRHLFRPLTGYGFGPLTFALIVASVVVFILSKFATDFEPVSGLFISEYLRGGGFLPEVRHGQVWRLFTPIFLHFGIWHILFNMMCLRDLGSMIEARQSTLHLAALVVVIAGVSNFAQYVVSGPGFGGMSGVVYGLLGYVWIRGKFDPASGLFLHQNTVIIMLVWFFLCLLGLIGHVANTVHTAGLVVGMAWGYLSSLNYR
jgi:GlpG protein